MSQTLDEQAEAFALAFADHGDEVIAALDAGYADPDRDGPRLLMTPGVAARLRDMALCRYHSHMNLMMRKLTDIARDHSNPARVRVQAMNSMMRLGREIAAATAGPPKPKDADDSQDSPLPHGERARVRGPRSGSKPFGRSLSQPSPRRGEGFGLHAPLDFARDGLGTGSG